MVELTSTINYESNDIPEVVEDVPLADVGTRCSLVISWTCIQNTDEIFALFVYITDHSAQVVYFSLNVRIL